MSSNLAGKSGAASHVSKSRETEEQQNSGIISKPLTVAADIARVLTVIPAISGAAAIGSTVLKAAASVAHSFGYDKPVDQTHRAFFKPAVCDPLNYGSGSEVIPRLSLAPAASVTNTSEAIDKCDFALFENYKQIPALIASFSASSTDTAGDVILEWPVAPWYSHYEAFSTGSRTYITPSSHLAMRHMYWRGGMKYKVYIFTQGFVSCRLRIAFFPSAHHVDPIPLEESGNYYTEVWDITGSGEYEFSVPFLKDLKYCQPFVAPAAAVLGSGTDLDNFLAHFCVSGLMSLSIFNPVVSPSAEVPYIRGLIYASCDDDMYFHEPQPMPLADYEWRNSVSEAGLDVRTAFQKQFRPIASAKKIVESGVNFPDGVSSFRTYFHRYQPMRQQWDANYTPIFGLPTAGYAILDINDGFYEPTLTPPAPNNITQTYHFDMNFMAACFQFRRGSTRLFFAKTDASVNTASTQTFSVVQLPPQLHTYQGNDPFDPTLTNSNFGSLAGKYTQTLSARPCLEVELPYKNAANYLCESLFERDFGSRVKYQFRIRDSSYTTTAIGRNEFAMAVGDDYAWVFPKSPPNMIIYTDVAEKTPFRKDVKPAMMSDGDPLGGMSHPAVTEQQELTTLKDIAPTETLEQNLSSSSLLIPVVYDKSEISTVMTRWYPYTFSWTSAMAVNTTLFQFQIPPDLFSTQPFLMEKLQNFQWMRCNFAATIKLNSTKLHAGALLISYIPHWHDRDFSDPYIGGYSSRCGREFETIWNASCSPHVLLDATNNNPEEIEIPLITPVELLNLAHLNESSVDGWFGTLNGMVAVPLWNLENSATSVHVTVAIQLRNVELYGPTVSISGP